jgi:hypothetical protein
MRRFALAVCAGAVIAVIAVSARGATKQGPPQSAAVKRGEYLVTIGGCNDCHTPWKMGPNGPEQDRSRLLSGHPEDLVMPSPPQPSPPWMVNVAGTFTAWAGPWGTSFTANLTPDPETGVGKWTVQNFIEAMRTGRHEGRGRRILPPMPWPNYAKMTDDDLKATFAYLQSIPAIRNHVPDPIISERPPQAAEAPAPAGAAPGGTGAGGEPSGAGGSGAAQQPR